MSLYIHENPSTYMYVYWCTYMSNYPSIILVCKSHALVSPQRWRYSCISVTSGISGTRPSTMIHPLRRAHAKCLLSLWMPNPSYYSGKPERRNHIHLSMMICCSQLLLLLTIPSNSKEETHKPPYYLVAWREEAPSPRKETNVAY